MMASGKASLQEISSECGFSDYRYFVGEFRERTGMLPCDYRRNPASIDDLSVHVHQSIHSLERFYTRKESLQIISRCRKALNILPEEHLDAYLFFD